MIERIKRAKQLKSAIKNLKRRSLHPKLTKAYVNKVYHSYIINGVILNRNSFEIRFKGKHIWPLKKRISNHVGYCFDLIDYYFSLFLAKMLGKRCSYIKLFKPLKVTSIKMTNAPDEFVFYKFLHDNGFEIVDEKLLPVDTIYLVKC